MPLLWISLAFLLGVLLGEMSWSRIARPVEVWLTLAGIAMTAFLLRFILRRFIARHPKLPSICLLAFLSAPVPYTLLFLILCLGALRFGLARPVVTPETLAWYNDQADDMVVEAVLVRPPDERDSYVSLRLKAELVQPVSLLTPSSVKGQLLARLPPGEDWRYGDRLRLQGTIQTPPENEDFSYREYLARQGILSYMPYPRAELLARGQGNWLLGSIYRFKAHALDTIYALFPDPQASIVAGVLLGVDNGIPEQVMQAFRDTGTAHILVVSGFNITVVAGMLLVLFGYLFGVGRLGARRAALVALAGIMFYAILVGGEPAVVRAAIMGGLALLAKQLGRQQDGVNTLVFVAAVMALFNPYLLWDVSFQLSFAATLGIILYADRFTSAFSRFLTRHLPQEGAQRLSRLVGEYFLVTLAAMILILPVIMYHFQRLSISALVANPLVLPAQPALMAFSGIAVLVGMVFAPLGQLLAYLAWPLAAYTTGIVEWLAGFSSGALSIGQVSLWVVAGYYAFILAVTFAFRTGFIGRLRTWAAQRWSGLPAFAGSLALLVMGLVSMGIWRAALYAPDGRLHLTVLDVGTGDALLIQTPAGRNVLVDGGPSARQLSDGLGRRLPLGYRKLDYLVVAATEAEQVAALPQVLERFPAGQVIWAGPHAGTRAARQLEEYLTDERVSVIPAQAGQILDLGQGARLHFLSAGQRGAVLLLEWDNFRALLPIGADFESLEQFRRESGLNEISALLLAESGYSPANPAEWIAGIQPQVVLLSVAAGDRHGLPAPETLDAVQGFTLLRTDRHGWIELTTDGEQMWVEVERP